MRFVLIFFLLSGCQTCYEQLEPVITPPSECVSKPSPAYPNISYEESRESWSKEYILAASFAQEQDYYRAITCYKRALFLLPPERLLRQQQLEYGIILSYYLGEKFQEVITTLEKSSLIELPPSFPAYEDLLIILYDSYQQIDDCDKAEKILHLIESHNRSLSENLTLSQALIHADLSYLSNAAAHESDAITEMLNCYAAQSKSEQTAGILNAILPGAGYYYVDQKQTALTSFVINALFIAAAYHFFEHGNIAAGLITTSLEAGWYFGGINGAKIAAHQYNERLYETLAGETACRERLFPQLMINYSF